MGEERSASAGRGDGDKKSMMRQVQPATKTAAPPSGTATARLSGNAGASPPLGAGLRPLPQCRLGSASGMQGAKPLASENPKTPPSPEGKGDWGDREKKIMMRQVQSATEKSSHPSKPTAAKKTVSRRRRPPLPPCSQSTSSTRQSGRTVRSDGCSTYRRISLKAEA